MSAPLSVLGLGVSATLVQHLFKIQREMSLILCVEKDQYRYMTSSTDSLSFRHFIPRRYTAQVAEIHLVNGNHGLTQSPQPWALWRTGGRKTSFLTQQAYIPMSECELSVLASYIHTLMGSMQWVIACQSLPSLGSGCQRSERGSNPCPCRAPVCAPHAHAHLHPL